MNNTISLFGTLALRDNDTWSFKGVICFDTSNEGCNINLNSIKKPRNLTGNGKAKPSFIEVPDGLTLSGTILPLCRDTWEDLDNMTMRMKSFRHSNRLEVELATSLLGTVVLSGSSTRSGKFWEIVVGAELEKPSTISYFQRKISWRQGIGSGKRIKVCGFQEDIPEPTFYRYDNLSKNRLKITWQVPVLVEGQIVSMQLLIKATSGQSWNLPFSENVPETRISPDHLAKTEVLGKVLKISLGPIALRSDRDQGVEGEMHTFYRNSTHSYVVENLNVGEYDVSIMLSLLKNDSESYEKSFGVPLQFGFLPFYIHPPPDPPTDLSVIVQKTKTTRTGSDEVICEPFVVVSWKSPKYAQPFALVKPKEVRGGPARSFSVGLQVFNMEQSTWQPFGEPIIMNATPFIEPDNKESCIIEALPETQNSKSKALYSKFRVFLKAQSKFGESSPIYSRCMDIPKFNIDFKSNSIDFCNIEEATCVICYEQISFEATKDMKDKICKVSQCNSGCYADGRCKRLPIKGVVSVPEEVFTCPVSPTCCSHLYHMKCLLDWSNSSRQRMGTSPAKCPLCMQDFKHVTTHVLEQEKQNSRQLLCATAQITKRPSLKSDCCSWRTKYGKRPNCELDDFLMVAGSIVSGFNL